MNKKSFAIVFIISFILSIILAQSSNAEIADVLTFYPDGSLIFIATDTKATTAIKYRTVGFTIFNSTRTASTVLMLEEVSSRDLGDGRVETTFETDQDTLFQRIGEADPQWQKSLYRDGGEVILDGIFTIVAYGEILGGLSNQGRSDWGEVHYTLPAIRNARAWADPSSLDQYFDKHLFFPSHPEFLSGTLHIRHFTTDGVPLQQYDTDRTLALDSSYPISVSGTVINDYTLTGSRLSYDTLPSGPLQPPAAYSITYDGQNFTDAYIYFYYGRNSGSIGENGMNALYASDTVPATVIRSDSRDHEIFDVTKGIPSSECLYVNAFGKNYLYDYDYREVTGAFSYPVEVTRTYNLSWSVDNGEYVTDANGIRRWVSDWERRTDTRTVTRIYQVARSYSYWTLSNLALYGLDCAYVNNSALPGGSVKLPPKGYIPPSLSTWTSPYLSDHIVEPVSGLTKLTLPDASLNGGRRGRPSIPDENWYTEADQQIGAVQVRNDRLVFNTHTLMSDSWSASEGPVPARIPNAPSIQRNILFMEHLQIPAEKSNGTYASTGTLIYKRIAAVNTSAPEIYSQAIANINPVLVHTPVACDGGIYNDMAFDQSISPDATRASVILGRSSLLRFSTQGNHRSIIGYGMRDYGKYILARQVQFPFDVYINATSADTSSFLPAMTWWNLPKGTDEIPIFIPTWAEEGNHTIQYRTIALNGSASGRSERLVNLDSRHTVATDSSQVRVIGRLYGFRITDIEHYPLWETVFRTSAGSLQPSGNYFSIGLKNQDGVSTLHSSAFTLPVLNGSHPTLHNQGALPLGYSFKYELDTVGDYAGDKDCIRVTPTFEYSPADGSRRQPVDLYYNGLISGNPHFFVRVGSDQDLLNIQYIRIGDADRMVPANQLHDTATILGISENDFMMKAAKLGWFDRQILSRDLRLFNGSTTALPASVPYNAARISAQHWYGEYHLPDETFAAPAGFDVAGYGRIHGGLNGNEAFWLKDGSIIVNFRIETIQDGDFDHPVLGYWNSSRADMWTIEGYNYIKKDSAGVSFNLKDGDVLFYDAGRRASEDYESIGTH